MHSQNLQEYVDFLRRALPEEDRIALPDAASLATTSAAVKCSSPNDDRHRVISSFCLAL